MTTKYNIDNSKILEIFNEAEKLDPVSMKNKSIIEKIPLDLTDNNGNNLIHKTILLNDFKKSDLQRLNFIKFLVNENVNPEEPNKNNQTPLHLACMKNYPYICEYLIKVGVNINFQDNMLNIPLDYAIHGKYVNYRDNPVYKIHNIADKTFIKSDKEKFLSRNNIIENRKLIWDTMNSECEEAQLYLTAIKNTIEQMIENDDEIKSDLNIFQTELLKYYTSGKTDEINLFIASQYDKIISKIKSKFFNNLSDIEEIKLHPKGEYSYPQDSEISIIDGCNVKHTLRKNIKENINNLKKKLTNTRLLTISTKTQLSITVQKYISLKDDEEKYKYDKNNCTDYKYIDKYFNKLKYIYALDLADDYILLKLNRQILAGGSRTVTINDSEYLRKTYEEDDIFKDDVKDTLLQILNQIIIADGDKINKDTEYIDIDDDNNVININAVFDIKMRQLLVLYIYYLILDDKKKFKIIENKLIDEINGLKGDDGKGTSHYFKLLRILELKQEKPSTMVNTIGLHIYMLIKIIYGINKTTENESDLIISIPIDLILLCTSLVNMTNQNISKIKDNLIHALYRHWIIFNIHKHTFSDPIAIILNLLVFLLGDIDTVKELKICSDDCNTNLIDRIIDDNLKNILKLCAYCMLNMSDDIDNIMTNIKEYLGSYKVDELQKAEAGNNTKREYVEYLCIAIMKYYNEMPGERPMLSTITDIIAALRIKTIFKDTDMIWQHQLNPYNEPHFDDKIDPLPSLYIYSLLEDEYKRPEKLIEARLFGFNYIGDLPNLDIDTKVGREKFNSIKAFGYYTYPDDGSIIQSDCVFFYKTYLARFSPPIYHLFITLLKIIFNRFIEKVNILKNDFKITLEELESGSTSKYISKIIELYPQIHKYNNYLSLIFYIYKITEDLLKTSNYKLLKDKDIKYYKPDFDNKKILNYIIIQKKINKINSDFFILYYIKTNGNTFQIPQLLHYNLGGVYPLFYYSNEGIVLNEELTPGGGVPPPRSTSTSREDFNIDNYELKKGKYLYTPYSYLKNNTFTELFNKNMFYIEPLKLNNNVMFKEGQLPPSLYDNIYIFYKYNMIELIKCVVNKIDTDNIFKDSNLDNITKKYYIAKEIEKITKHYIENSLYIYAKKNISNDKESQNIKLELIFDKLVFDIEKIDISNIENLSKLDEYQDSLSIYHSFTQPRKYKDIFISYNDDKSNLTLLKSKYGYNINLQLIKMLIENGSDLYNKNISHENSLMNVIKTLNHNAFKDIIFTSIDINTFYTKINPFQYVIEEYNNHQTNSIDESIYTLYSDITSRIGANPDFNNNIMANLKNSFIMCYFIINHKLEDMYKDAYYFSTNYTNTDKLELDEIIEKIHDNIKTKLNDKLKNGNNLYFINEIFREFKLCDNDKYIIIYNQYNQLEEIREDKYNKYISDFSNIIRYEIDATDEMKERHVERVNEYDEYRETRDYFQNEIVNKFNCNKRLYKPGKLKNHNIVKFYNNISSNKYVYLDAWDRYIRLLITDEHFELEDNHKEKEEKKKYFDIQFDKDSDKVIDYQRELLPVLLLKYGKDNDFYTVMRYYSHIAKHCETYFKDQYYLDENHFLKITYDIILHLIKTVLCSNIQTLIHKVMYYYFNGKYKNNTNNYIKFVFTAKVKEYLYKTLPGELIKNNLKIFKNSIEEDSHINKSITELFEDLFTMLKRESKLIIIDENIIQLLNNNVVDYYDTIIPSLLNNWQVLIENQFKFYINHSRIMETLYILNNS
jgi:hypothetical protein